MNLISDLRELADSKRAEILKKFFKMNSGEYGEGDIFLGIYSRQIKDVAKKYHNLSLDDLGTLIQNPVHDCRVCVLRILVDKYKKSDVGGRKKIFDFYLDNLENVNNWDLVDLSAWKIVGDFLLDEEDRSILDELAFSENMWARRVAIVSTFAFIREGEFDDVLRIAKILVGDDEDLIRKAVGWMLREVGKKDGDLLRSFLGENYDKLSRTTLRYAIERFGREERDGWMRGNL